MIMPKEIYDMDLTHREISVYRYLCDRANCKGECYPSCSRIAKELKLSPRTVFRAISDLEGRRLITKKKRKRANGGTSSNLYKLGVI